MLNLLSFNAEFNQQPVEIIFQLIHVRLAWCPTTARFSCRTSSSSKLCWRRAQHAHALGWTCYNAFVPTAAHSGRHVGKQRPLTGCALYASARLGASRQQWKQKPSRQQKHRHRQPTPTQRHRHPTATQQSSQAEGETKMITEEFQVSPSTETLLLWR